MGRSAKIARWADVKWPVRGGNHWGKMAVSSVPRNLFVPHFTRLFLVLLVLPLLVACRPPRPSYDYRTGDVLLEEDFDRDFAWENFASGDGTTRFQVEDGVYHMQMSGGGYNWALNALNHRDVVIDVYGSQRSEYANNAYGVICRADPGGSGDGYYFYISGDGYWSIRRAQGRTVTPLVEFTRSDAIHQGQSINLIRVLCIEDYLALYVNEQFVGEITDDTYSSGVAGFSVAVPDEGDIDVSFDNLRIIEASIVHNP